MPIKRHIQESSYMFILNIQNLGQPQSLVHTTGMRKQTTARTAHSVCKRSRGKTNGGEVGTAATWGGGVVYEGV